METKSYTKRINEVYDAAEDMVKYLIRVRGKESKVNGEKCLPIPDDFQDNVDSTYIVEVNEEYFVTDNGNYYQYSSIAMDRFCEIADQLVETVNKAV